MKKIIITMAAIAAAFTIASCNKELVETENNPTEGNCIITASTESNITKTSLSGDDTKGYDVVWSEGDSFKIGEETFTLIEGEGTTAGKFQGTLPEGDGPFTAYYPATYNGTDWPALQTYTEGNITGSPMTAEVVKGAESLSFKNAGGILRLTVKNDDSACVKSITINAAELTSPITFDCGTGGVALTDAGVDFYIAMPSGSTSKTYTKVRIELATIDGKICTKTLKSSTGGLAIQRSKITPASFNTVFATDLSAAATANTYMVSSAGFYGFNATVKGNGGLDPLTGTTATTINPSDIAGVKVLWEVYAQGRAIKHNGSSYDIKYDGGYIYFNTPDTFVEGDVCVAIYDNENKILWSWLIWATNDPGTLVHNTKTFMARNLGAFDIGNQMRGFLYQWGRKDAFSAADGGYKTYTYVPSFDTAFNWVNSAQSISWSIQNPTTRVLSDEVQSTESWLTADEYGLKPWRDDVKTIYDPCPPGWRVPSKAEMDGISGLPGTGFSAGTGFGNPHKGYYWTSTISSDSTHPDYAWAYCNDGRNMQNWPQGEVYAIRPICE